MPRLSVTGQRSISLRRLDSNMGLIMARELLGRRAVGCRSPNNSDLVCVLTREWGVSLLHQKPKNAKDRYLLVCDAC